MGTVESWPEPLTIWGKHWISHRSAGEGSKAVWLEGVEPGCTSPRPHLRADCPWAGEGSLSGDCSLWSFLQAYNTGEHFHLSMIIFFQCDNLTKPNFLVYLLMIQYFTTSVFLLTLWFHFMPITGRLAMQPLSVLTRIPCNAICENDNSPWRTFGTMLWFPVFSPFVILFPLLTQSIILGRCVVLVCPFCSVGNTILFLLSKSCVRKIKESLRNTCKPWQKTQTIIGARNRKQWSNHLEIIVIVSQQHKSVTYSIHSMAESAYIFPLSKIGVLTHM